MERAIALKTMERHDGHGKRTLFDILVCTANRENYREYKKLNGQLSALTEGSQEYDKIKKKRDRLNLGGMPLQFTECVLSGERGIHSKLKKRSPDQLAAKNPNHWKNHTRNITTLGNDTIKIHTHLIMELNGVSVNY